MGESLSDSYNPESWVKEAENLEKLNFRLNLSKQSKKWTCFVWYAVYIEIIKDKQKLSPSKSTN